VNARTRICFLTGSAADWGGASRVLYTTLRGMDLTRVEPLVLLSGEGPIKADLEALGIRCLIWGPAQEPDDKLAYLKVLFRALRLFRHERIAVLHVNHRFWRPAEVLAALLLRIPVLVHVHVVNQQTGSFMDRCRAACDLRLAFRSVVITSENPSDQGRLQPDITRAIRKRKESASRVGRATGCRGRGFPGADSGHQGGEGLHQHGSPDF